MTRPHWTAQADFLFSIHVGKALPGHARHDVPTNLAGEPMVVIHAFEGRVGGSHNRIDVVVTQGKGRVVFPRGQLYCSLPTFKAIDGPDARELVLLLVAMKPPCFGHCDTDADYFADYTSEQLAWAERHGDIIAHAAAARYPLKEKA